MLWSIFPSLPLSPDSLLTCRAWASNIRQHLKTSSSSHSTTTPLPLYYLTLVNQHPCYWIIVLFFLVLTLLTFLLALPNSVSAFHAGHLPASPGNNPPDSGKEKKLEVLSSHSFAQSDALYVPCSVISVSPTKQICFPHTPKSTHLDVPVHINLPFPLLHWTCPSQKPVD